MKSKKTAGWLALLLGGIGVHRFYLGQTGLGFVYLLFFWTGVPMLVSLIDAIVFFSMSRADFDRKYNTTPLPMSYHMQSHYTSKDPTKEIKKLYDLKEQGVITEDEFRMRKNNLLNS